MSPLSFTPFFNICSEDQSYLHIKIRIKRKYLQKIAGRKTSKHSFLLILVFPYTVISDKWIGGERAGRNPDILHYWTATEWASLRESQIFSFWFTWCLNMFCFELTTRCQGSVPFFSLSHGLQLNPSAQLTSLRRTHLRVTAVQGLTQVFAVWVCVFVIV